MDKVLDLITNQCESCRLREKCIEDECVLYQIEQTILIENQKLKDKLKGVQEERDYLFNKQSIENKYLALENKQLKEVIEEVKTEISSLMSKYFYEKDFCIEDIHLDKLLQILDKVKEQKND